MYTTIADTANALCVSFICAKWYNRLEVRGAEEEMPRSLDNAYCSLAGYKGCRLVAVRLSSQFSWEDVHCEVCCIFFTCPISCRYFFTSAVTLMWSANKGKQDTSNFAVEQRSSFSILSTFDAEVIFRDWEELRRRHQALRHKAERRSRPSNTMTEQPIMESAPSCRTKNIAAVVSKGAVSRRGKRHMTARLYRVC